MKNNNDEGNAQRIYNFNAQVGQFIEHVDTVNFSLTGDGQFKFENVGKVEADLPKDDDALIAERLSSIFFGDRQAAANFVKTIRGRKPAEVTEIAKRLVAEKIISGLSSRRDLWQMLHEAGLYEPSETNWNKYMCR